MKRKVISWLALLCCLSAMQATAQTSVSVVYWTGQPEVLQVQEDGGFYFSDDNLVISTVQGNDRTFAMSSIRKLLFSSGTVGTQTLTSNGLMAIYPSPVSNVLNVIHAGSATMQYSLYSANGALLGAGSLCDNASIDVSALSAGFYFLNVDGQILKFTKR